MKKWIFILVVLCSSIRYVSADEGMWLPLLIDRLNYVDMQKMGLKLSADEIYSVNHSSLKDAIVQFGNGCTGEIVSKQGLLLTNHHCGYGSIQGASSVEHDYLTHGFWAMSLQEEIPIPGLTVKFLVRMEDVSSKVMAGLPSHCTEKERSEKLPEIFKRIQNEASRGTGYEAVVKNFFDGNEFYLFVYEIFKDIRLVGAPPSSIGKFGADTDNWMWPRHTGDFSMFRVYASKEGKPSLYNKENVPYTPKHSLKVSIKGTEKNDFAMILGYPGTTDRFLTSYGVKNAIDNYNPTVVSIREKKLEIMKSYMNKSDEVRIQYASKYAQIANYWKYYIGQTRGLKRLNVYDKKKQEENEFREWLAADGGRFQEYGHPVDSIAVAYNILMRYSKQKVYFQEALLSGTSFIPLIRPYENLLNQLKSDSISKEKLNKTITELKEAEVKFFKDYNADVDMSVFSEMLMMANTQMEETWKPEVLKKASVTFKNNFKAYVHELYSGSFFTNQSRLEKFLSAPTAKAIEKDAFYRLMKSFVQASKLLNEKTEAPTMTLNEANRKFVAGIRQMHPQHNYAPNANSTLRMTYGQVLDYFPADAIHFEYFTTLDGIIEKEDPSNPEFVVPAKLKELYKTKDYGIYGKNGIMRTCFITNNDITGGNSGSPVMDGNGCLIGLAFDGNWEAMSGNIAFEPALQRTINVDIRYVLFIIDKFAGDRRLVEEMELVQQ